ncbi:Tryptophan--tRNA ligase [Buchnera aphidicola (Cinara pseudotaxifoliae)]|uniref:Tryptophan--tRNA ligase n=1 Tax=Buchnera aphidicola (Cinara pseudotaxifoliae) TaxID=655384 RepID=A0A451DHT9_9GAMM|nr:tryptophan--tRNA ligase [Buchnera aphidicola]VFP86213.1 Tryptophan--tRNA ligase [Buchnera aphidicola (Cinara pseudotaxifoliae)]
MLNIKKKDIMFTGIQPTGLLTLGNYCGTMCNWKDIQKKYECFFCIADLHALTTFSRSGSNKNSIKNNFSTAILDIAALYLSCGVDPNRSTIFVQSHVYTHSQLYWILSNFVYFGELSRMTQFKQKLSLTVNTPINLSLFCYPVLMAADILLYHTNYVLVGSDQKQHLELVQKIAHRFNSIYGNIFIVPDILILPVGNKIMALQDPTKKMSKSDKNTNNTIFLLENIHSIYLKLQRSLTDSDCSSSCIRYDILNKPGVSNLLSIFSCMTNKKISILEDEFKNCQYSIFKKKLSDVVCDTISEIQAIYFKLRQDEDYLIDVLIHGEKNALKYSINKLDDVFQILNL